MIKNPLEQSVPDDKRLQVRDFARDWAWGVVNKDWKVEWSFENITMNDFIRQGLLYNKWKGQFPPSKLLQAFGYIDEDGHLTLKSFDLLDQASPAPIFISYRRSESSAFALYLVERMRMVGLDPFFDIKDIKTGVDWHALLKEEIQKRDYFVCLVGPKTLVSKYVREEIQWAQEKDGMQVLPVYHNGFTGRESVPAENPEILADTQVNWDAFFKVQVAKVKTEDPSDYRTAVDQLLNVFGFVPYNRTEPTK